ncbi:GNAT family N-acetyltransferase [Streptomyces sp. NPDC052109]|uniref:GNAT family N-acetyltransferase n=1 Tax=Streptomyces sp. NPDC052109 TaxID=3155527 RepID=UPI003438A766
MVEARATNWNSHVGLPSPLVRLNFAALPLIRPAMKEDRSSVSQLYADTQIGDLDSMRSFQVMRILSERWRGDREHMALETQAGDADIDERLNCMVVDLDGQIAGAINAGIEPSGRGHLHALVVQPGKRRQGLGTLLLAAVTQQMHERGVTEQWATIRARSTCEASF